MVLVNRFHHSQRSYFTINRCLLIIAQSDMQPAFEKIRFKVWTDLSITHNLCFMNNAILGPLWLWDIQKHDFKWIQTSFLCQKWFSKKQKSILKFLQCIITIIDYCTKSYLVAVPHFRSLPFDSKVRHLHHQTLIHDIS